MRFLKTLIVVLVVGFSLGIVIFIDHKNDKVCDTLVILDDDTKIECTKSSSHNNGMTWIKTCNGENMEIPTYRIKMIKHIETND